AGKLVPLLAGVFLVAGLASLALPGTSPFVSEFLVLLGTFTVHKAVAVVATAGIILAAGYVLWMVQRTIHGAPNPALEQVEGLRRRARRGGGAARRPAQDPVSAVARRARRGAGRALPDPWQAHAHRRERDRPGRARAVPAGDDPRARCRRAAAHRRAQPRTRR